MPVSSVPVTSLQAEDERVFDRDQEGFSQDYNDEGTTSSASSIPILRTTSTDPVVEISSSSSAAGKSHFLYYLTAVAILPGYYKGVRLDGRNAAVVFIDTDGRFDADRLLAVARGIVQRKGMVNAHPATLGSDDSNGMDAEAMLFSALHHVHVFRPQSSSSLLATLRDLVPYLFGINRHVSSSRPLHAIILDSATAFIWQDKLRDDIARVEEIGQSSADIERERLERKRFQLSILYTDLLAELKRLQGRFGCAVVYTCTAWSGQKRAAPDSDPAQDHGLYHLGAGVKLQGPSLRPPLPPPWGFFPHLRLVARRDGVKSFPPGWSVEEARRDAPKRQEVVRRDRFLASVNAWGSEGWHYNVVEVLKKKNGFSFYIDAAGVRMDES